jgi:hypothetical protein
MLEETATPIPGKKIAKGKELGFGDIRAFYMEPHQPGDTNNLHLYIQFTGTWFLMFVNLVPISLLVCLETVKFIQGFLLGWDLQMYDYENDVSMIA